MSTKEQVAGNRLAKHPALAATPFPARAFLNASVAIAVTRRADGVLIDANSAFCEMVGRPKEDVIGKPSLEL